MMSGLPLVGLDLPVPRPRLVFAAPLAVGVPAERELLDIFLVDRRPVAEVRARLADGLPAGHELVDVHDAWLGEPALSGQVVAADYRVQVSLVDGGPPDPAALAGACAQLIAAVSIPMTRDKGGRSVPYDLRPLVADIEVEGDHEVEDDHEVEGGHVDARTLRIRTRFDPERGVGRPEEVLAALSELAGVPLVARSIVRERVLLAGEA